MSIDHEEFYRQSRGRKAEFAYLVTEFRRGLFDLEVGGRKYRAVKGLGSADLKAGMLVAASHTRYNLGISVYKVLGFTGDEEKYGDGGVKFESVKELLTATGDKGLKALDDRMTAEIQAETRKYGYFHYLVVEDQRPHMKYIDGEVTGTEIESGPWFFLDGSRWCLGSGSEPLSFILVEEVTPEMEARMKATTETMEQEAAELRRQEAEIRAQIAELSKKAGEFARQVWEIEAKTERMRKQLSEE